MKRSCDFKFFDDERGSLSAFDKIPSFSVRRFYFIKCNEKMKRGNHYHKVGKQIIFLIEGQLLVNVTKENLKENFVMNPGDSYFQDTFCKFEFESQVESSKLLVLCDTEHDTTDYYITF